MSSRLAGNGGKTNWYVPLAIRWISKKARVKVGRPSDPLAAISHTIKNSILADQLRVL
jgi:hypothetical protein